MGGGQRGFCKRLFRRFVFGLGLGLGLELELELGSLLQKDGQEREKRRCDRERICKLYMCTEGRKRKRKMCGRERIKNERRKRKKERKKE